MTNDQRPTATIVVTAAVVEIDGRYLVTRRQTGVHLEGLWEFPGGKCDRDETLKACLAREILEELDVAARIGEELFKAIHAYPDRSVEIHFFSCELLGEPRAALGQEMQWVRREDLAALDFPPADGELIRMLEQA